MSRIVIDGRPLFVRGGMQTYVRELLRGLAALDCPHEFVVAVPQEYHGPPEIDLEFVRLAGPKVIWTQVTLPYLAARQRAELTHATKHVGPILHQGRLVVTVPDLMYFTFPELWRPGEGEYWRLMTRLSVPRADAVIFISEQSREDGLELGIVKQERAFAVPLAAAEHLHHVADAEAIGAASRKYGIEGRYVLTVGTLGPKKNVETIIRAFALVQQRGGDESKLVITGRDAAAGAGLRQTVADLKLGEEVVFTGWVDSEDLAALYSGAELFAFAALYEGFGLPPLEAMQCGTPVVSSREGSLAEVVDGAAVTLDDPADVEELAAKMLEVSGDAEMQERLRVSGLQRAGEYSWEKTAQETVYVYDRVLQQGEGDCGVHNSV